MHPDSVLFGAIADDYTGGADLASMLRNRGVSTVQVFGLQEAAFLRSLNQYRAVVISLKSRSLPVEQACSLSVRALDQLRQLQAYQIQFKYCSTFDSTPQGNIGPVMDRLLRELDVNFTVAVPALPVNGRTQYMGHLFVGSTLLSESHMRHHPLNPMKDSNLVRHLQAQTSRKVGLVSLDTVHRGTSYIQEECRRLEAAGVSIALTDAVRDEDLDRIAEAVADLPFITGGSGLAMSLPKIWKQRGWLQPALPESKLTPLGIKEGVFIASGSCSAVTLQQIRTFSQVGGQVLHVDVSELLTQGMNTEMARLLSLIQPALQSGACVMVTSSAGPEERERVLRSSHSSAEEISLRIEEILANLTAEIIQHGLSRRIIIAGGETSGAVLDILKIRAVEVLQTIDPGVPSLKSIDPDPIALALKSGNFGAQDFFHKAADALRSISLSEGN